MNKLFSANYSKVCDIYDHMMRKVRYDFWADYINSIAEEYIDENALVLELAAGNCRLAKYLSAYYPKLIATDLSVPMLNKYQNSNFPKVCCDMMSLPFNGKFNLVVSAFDSINYILTKKNLLLFFKEIRRVLSNNSIFTFDVSLEKNSFKHVKDPIRMGSYKGVKYKQETMFDSNKNIHTNFFSITYPNGQVYNEIHTQKIYSLDTYFDTLEKADLAVKDCFDAFTFKNGNENSSRVQFITVTK
jgi:hypothetical protein